MRQGLLLALVVLLAGCESQEARDARRIEAAREAAALRYRTLCVEAIARYRAFYVPDQAELPSELDGATCGGEALRNYRLPDTFGRTVEGSSIRADPQRLSGYILEVRGKDGKTYEYVDRGDAAAAAEQAGTFELDTSEAPEQPSGPDSAAPAQE